MAAVLASSFFWAARLQGWPLRFVPLVWALGVFVYASVVALCIRPLIPPKGEGHVCGRPSYDAVRAQRFYDWHNCNPIKVLLSHCSEGVSPQQASPIKPFQVGKEYLQAFDPGWREAIETSLREQDSNTVEPGGPRRSWLEPKNLPNVPEMESLI